MSEIVIRPLKESDLKILSEVADRRLGEGYFDYDDFLFRTKYPELNLVAEEGGKPVAILSMTPEDPESLAKTMKTDLDQLLKDANGKPTLHFRTAMCDEDHDKTGLIKRMLVMAISNARDLGYGLIISPTWKYDGKTPALRLQTDLGFVSIGEKKMLWYDQKGYTCVFCKGPCKCDAELMELIL